MLGLKRGTVRLCDHEAEWERNAQATIVRLQDILGNKIKAIAHVGSTAVGTIKAKPIIDIAVAVTSFEEILSQEEELKAAGFHYRPSATLRHRKQLLFGCGSFYEGTGAEQTHFIHVVYEDSADWHNYIKFKEYLLTHPAAAKEYEALKVSLCQRYFEEGGREQYTAAKHDFINQILKKTD